MTDHPARSIAHTRTRAKLRLGIAGLNLLAAVSLMPAAAAAPSPDKVAAAQDATPPPGSSNAPAQQDHGKYPAFDPVAARIKYLHDRLLITPAQEPLWNNLAQILRENAAAVAPLANKRLHPAPDRTAVETLGIYQKLGEVQMEGLKKFVAAFQALYDVLSEHQKKIADVLFRTSPLSMVGSIPELPWQLYELPPASRYAYAAPLQGPGQLPYPIYEGGPLYPAYPYYPYYPALIPGVPIGLGSSFFLLVPRHHHHRAWLPGYPPFRAGAPHVRAPGIQRFRTR
jgi:hypothetical protein